MSASDDTLFFLWRMRMRGKWRLLARRARTPGGAITIVIGLLIIGLWIASVVLRGSLIERTGATPSVEAAQLGLFVYLGFVAFSSLSFRGVYLPRSELDRLFSAPLSRSSIVRYRVLKTVIAALPFIVLMTVFLAPRFPSAVVGTTALVITIPTTTVFGQGLSLLAARTHGALHSLLARVSPGVLRLVGGGGIVGVLLLLAFGPGIDPVRRGGAAYLRDFEAQSTPESIEIRPRREEGPSEQVPESELDVGRFERIARHPAVKTVTSPLYPWARALTAPNGRSGLPWLAAILGLFVLSFELVARLPIDYRESSLRTSIDFEKRIARLRSGQGGAGAFSGPSRTRSWSVPWLAGRSPTGAVVWMRTAWIARQARGTLVIAGIVAVLGVVVGTRVLDGPGGETATLAALGVIYLSSGLRADFRTDLDRLEIIKAWPLPAWRTFAASLVPTVALTTLVVYAVLLVRAAILGQFEDVLPAVLLAVPGFAYLWSGIDNAVFLLFPVRFVPGQGSAIQHTGRGVLLVLLRALVLAVLIGFILGGAATTWSLLGGDEGGLEPIVLWSVLAAWIVVGTTAALVAVTRFGAFTLRRFDVTRVPLGS